MVSLSKGNQEVKHKPLDYEYDTVKNSAPYTVSAFNHLNKYHMTSKSVRSHYSFLLHTKNEYDNTK